MPDPSVRRVTSAGGVGTNPGLTLDQFGNQVITQHIFRWVADGRVFVAGGADEDTNITGQTSYAATTPTFLLDVPSGTTCVPLWVRLAQVGTVAGNTIFVRISQDRVGRYSSGGTSQAVTALRTDRPTPSTVLCYSGATAAAAAEARRLWATTLNKDVGAGTTPSEVTAVDFSILKNVTPYLVGPAAFMVFTWAGTTGPTWAWSLGWAELPTIGAT